MAEIIYTTEGINDSWLLPNGLRVVGERLPYLRSVSIGVWLHVGSMMETPAENGLSHFLEHMVFKGTTHRTNRQIAEDMDAVGGQMNAFTGKDCTCLYAKVIDEDLALAVDMLADLAIHATIDEGEFEKERGVILEEIAMDEDSPEDLVHDMLAKAMYAEQALGMPILGTEEKIASVSRQELVDFRSRHYSPKDTVLSLAGNYDPAEMTVLLEKYFGEWNNASAPIIVPQQKVFTGCRLAREKDTEQLHICMGWEAAAFDAQDKYPQAVLSTVLGGAMSSRLFQRIREELGMAYSIYTFSNSYAGSGSFGVYAGVSPKNGQRVLEEIDKELKRFLQDGMTEMEFRSAKVQLRSTHLMGLESPGSRMQANGRRMLLVNKRINSDEALASIDAITPDSVMAYAHRILTPEPSMAFIGRGTEKFLK